MADNLPSVSSSLSMCQVTYHDFSVLSIYKLSNDSTCMDALFTWLEVSPNSEESSVAPCKQKSKKKKKKKKQTKTF